MLSLTELLYTHGERSCYSKEPFGFSYKGSSYEFSLFPYHNEWQIRHGNNIIGYVWPEYTKLEDGLGGLNIDKTRADIEDEIKRFLAREIMDPKIRKVYDAIETALLMATMIDDTRSFRDIKSDIKKIKKELKSARKILIK